MNNFLLIFSIVFNFIYLPFFLPTLFLKLKKADTEASPNTTNCISTEKLSIGLFSYALSYAGLFFLVNTSIKLFLERSIPSILFSGLLTTSLLLHLALFICWVMNKRPLKTTPMLYSLLSKSSIVIFPLFMDSSDAFIAYWIFGLFLLAPTIILGEYIRKFQASDYA